VRAFKLTKEHIGTTAGQIYNIGGGPANTLAVWSEFGELIAGLKGEHVPVRYNRWRPVDQPCYVSDIRKAQTHMGWKPKIDKLTGIRRLWEWICSNDPLFASTPAMKTLRAGAGERIV
jgi:CDP-paratose 2-epimerase